MKPALWQRADELCEKNPALRRGQALFIALTELNPDKADRIRGTKFDPFYSNSRINAFLREVEG